MAENSFPTCPHCGLPITPAKPQIVPDRQQERNWAGGPCGYFLPLTHVGTWSGGCATCGYQQHDHPVAGLVPGQEQP